MEEINDRKEFVIRADDIQDEDLLDWTVETRHFQEIQKKLFEKSTILLAGPRGSGKTHHMKFAYKKSLLNSNYPMTIYVSFGKYYHLEPLLFKSPSAYNIFHIWVLGKILLGCEEFLTSLRKSGINKCHEIDILELFPKLENFVSQAEKSSQADELASKYIDLLEKLTFHEVVKTLEMLSNKLERKRIVLFLDDAALTLTPNYMHEFFDIFRSLKSSRISPKASVYPGTTEYGPRFHVGHDAIKVDCWLNVEDKSYSEFIDQLIEKRFPQIPSKISKDIIDLLKYAAFGIPRVFINLIRGFEERKNKRPQEVFNSVIDEQAALIKDEYDSLTQKTPQYKTIIRTGADLFEEITNILTKENHRIQEKGKNEKCITIGIQQKQKYNLNISRMIRFLIEAGLLFPLSPVRHGSSSQREYERFIPHLIFLIKKRAFSIGRGFNAKEILSFLKRESAKHPARRIIDRILDKDKIKKIKLDLPPCSHCGALRLSEDQKFCHNCGYQLTEKSRFEECMKIPINDLPLPIWQKKRLRICTKLNTIEDIIAHSDPGSELQKIKHVGPIRAEKIYNSVKSYVEEFLG